MQPYRQTILVYIELNRFKYVYCPTDIKRKLIIAQKEH